MCGAFYVDGGTLSSVRKIVQRVDPEIGSICFFGDIHPTDMALVMVGDNGKLKLACQRWGYPGIQGNGVIFNARAESVTLRMRAAEVQCTSGAILLRIILTRGSLRIRRT